MTVLEGPDASDALRHHAGQDDADWVILRHEIILAHAFAVAGFHQLAGAVDAQAFDGVTRPAAAVAVDLKTPFGAEHAIVAAGDDVTLEIDFAAEQAEPVLDFPVDPQ